jgi:hypothetical protein
MTDDIVTRLRELNTFEWHARPATTKETCFEAANRIERLEAALREVISVSDRRTDIYDRAKALLEKKDD